MTTETIFDKYATALADLGAAGVAKLSSDAMLLALRLAIGDAYAAGAALCDDLAAIVASQTQADAEVRELRLDADNAGLAQRLRTQAGAVEEAARLREEIADLREQVIPDYQASLANLTAEIDRLTRQNAHAIAVAWVEEIDRLREQLAAMDADNARLIASLTAADKIQETLHQAIADRDAEIDRLTRQNVIVTDTFNGLSAERTNGNGANPTPAAQPDGWGRNHPAWDGLSDDQRVTLYRLAKGELKFRQISREDRIDLAGRVLRHLADADGNVTGPIFDRLRPEWMPTAGAVVLLADSRKWNDLLTLVATHAPA